MEWKRPARNMAQRCWRCNARMRPDQLLCTHCGATRATSQVRAQTGRRRGAATEDDDDTPGYADIAADYVPNRAFGAPIAPPRGSTAQRKRRAASEDYWPDEPDIPLERNLPKRRQPHPLQWVRYSWLHGVFIRITNILFAIGFGLVGGFLGGSIWCAVQTTFQFRLGVLAVVMGYLTGQGVSLGSATRSLVTTLLALALTVFVWAVCTRYLLGQGFDLLPVDGLFLFAALIVSTIPTRLVPAKDP
jgi:hypothetical protein